MNEPTPAAPSDQIPTTINIPDHASIWEFEAIARANMPVPTEAIIVTQAITTGIDNCPPSTRWTISHFAPDVYNQCTQGEGQTPTQALSRLLNQLTPCA